MSAWSLSTTPASTSISPAALLRSLTWLDLSNGILIGDPPGKGGCDLNSFE